MKKRILILGCKNYPAFSSSKVISGGMEVYVTELVKVLKERFDVSLIAADSSSDNPQVDVVSVPIFGGFIFQPVSLLFFSFFKSFRYRRKAALINTQTPLSGLTAWVLKKLYKIPYVVTVHIFAATKEHTGNSILSGIYRIVEKIVYSNADMIVCAGYRLREHMTERYKLDEGRVTVIHPGGDVEAMDSDVTQAEADEMFPNENGAFRVLFLGRLIHENGIMDTLEAIRRLSDKNVKLLIAGNGNLEAAIRRYINDAGLTDKIEMLDIVRGRRKEALLKSVDAVIRTSYHEVFPVAYLESLAYGVPVIATAVGDTEYMAEKAPGIKIVPIKDPAATAEAIEEFMGKPGLSAETVEQCRAYLKSISWARQGQLTASLFDEVLGKEG